MRRGGRGGLGGLEPGGSNGRFMQWGETQGRQGIQEGGIGQCRKLLLQILVLSIVHPCFAADGRRDPRGFGCRRPDASDPGTHPAG